MSTAELIIFCVLVVPMIAAMIWALVKETQTNARLRRSAAILAEIQTRFYRNANCIISEKYKNILIEKEKKYEN